MPLNMDRLTEHRSMVLSLRVTKDAAAAGIIRRAVVRRAPVISTAMTTLRAVRMSRR
jgi:hypothetical protein